MKRFFFSLKPKSIFEHLHKTEGGSGSFFLNSLDGHFFVKSISEDDVKVLIEMLPFYFQYLNQNKESLLVRFFGLYELIVEDAESLFVIVMGNVLSTEYEIHERFDLKGSWVGRKAISEKRSNKDEFVDLESLEDGIPKNFPKCKLGKDIDFKDRKILLPIDQITKINEIVKKDVEFLKSMQVMDYSFLIGIHEVQTFATHPSLHSKTSDDIFTQLFEARGWTSDDGRFVYFIGLIDILQKYDSNKRIEHFVKITLLCQDKNGISVVEPNDYAERFLNFVTSIFPSQITK